MQFVKELGKQPWFVKRFALSKDLVRLYRPGYQTHGFYQEIVSLNDKNLYSESKSEYKRPNLV